MKDKRFIRLTGNYDSSETLDETIFRLDSENFSGEEIAKEVGVTRATVLRVIRDRKSLEQKNIRRKSDERCKEILKKWKPTK